MARKQLISIVTPCFNEELVIEDCYLQVREVFDTELSDYDYEHIFCDNASTDSTLEKLRVIAAQDKNVKIIENSRNFGPFASMFNGLLATSGDGVVPFLPADCQDPPSVIPEFVKLWQSGSEVVFGVRDQREESKIMAWIRRRYYRVVNKFANINIPLNVGEFTLLDRQVVSSLKEVDDYYPYLRGLIANAGFKTSSVKYTWAARKRGFSKNNAYSLIDQGLNGLISFTNIPMRFVMLSGFLISIVSLIYAVWTAISALILHPTNVQPGIQTLISAVFFFSGVILFALGIVGEYVSAIHFQVRKRPLVIERSRINF